jgi:hypothetical protein
MTITEIPLPEDGQLAEIAREAAVSGDVIWLTDQGRRIVAIVPAGMAAVLELTDEAMHRRRILGARAVGRSGQHDISERIEEILRSEVAS